MSREGWTVLLLVVAVTASALAVVGTRHAHRGAFVELQAATAEADRLQEEWGMLQLEQGAWAGHSRVERLAADELEMVLPEREEIETVVRRNREGE